MEVFTSESVSLITAVLLFLNLAASVHILLYKASNPSGAILWLFIIFSIPGGGLFLYSMFGINRVRSTGMRIQQSEARLSSVENHILPGIRARSEIQKKYLYTPYSTSFKQYFSALDYFFPENPPLSGNTIMLLEDGTMTYPHMIDAINNAKISIHLQSYIIMADDTGRQVFELLNKKANEGVQIKVLYDRLGSFLAFRAMFFKRYSKHHDNFKVLPFSQSNLWSPWRIQLRNHRKILVIDGKTAFVGGVNISQDNDKKRCKKNKYIHDLHCKITGPAVGELQFTFLKDWHYATRNHVDSIFIKDHFPEPEADGNSIIRIIDSGPGQRESACHKNFQTAIDTASESIWIMTPYFIPSKSLITIMIMASVKNIDVRIILPQTSDHRIVKYASRSFYKELIKNGIRIYERPGNFMHAKTMLIDGNLALMGSSNVDNRSFHLNFETDFICSDNKLLEELHSLFINDFDSAHEITQSDIIKKSLSTTLLENTCSLLSPIL